MGKGVGLGFEIISKFINDSTDSQNRFGSFLEDYYLRAIHCINIYSFRDFLAKLTPFCSESGKGVLST